MFEQGINRTYLLNQRRRTRLVGQRETVDFAKHFSQLGTAPAADPLRLDIVSGAGEQAEINSRPPLRGTILEHPRRIALMRGPEFVIVDHRIGDRREL